MHDLGRTSLSADRLSQHVGEALLHGARASAGAVAVIQRQDLREEDLIRVGVRRAVSDLHRGAGVEGIASLLAERERFRVGAQYMYPEAEFADEGDQPWEDGVQGTYEWQRDDFLAVLVR